MLITILLYSLGMAACFALIASLYKLIASIFLKASPLITCIAFGFGSRHWNGWIATILLVVIVYSLMSYDKIRKAIISVCSGLCSSFVVFIFTALLTKFFSVHPLVQAIATAVVIIACIIYSRQYDAGSDYICIDVMKYFDIPMLIQQIIASALYGFTAAVVFNFAFSETTLVKTQDGPQKTPSSSVTPS